MVAVGLRPHHPAAPSGVEPVHRVAEQLPGARSHPLGDDDHVECQRGDAVVADDRDRDLLAAIGAPIGDTAHPGARRRCGAVTAQDVDQTAAVDAEVVTERVHHRGDRILPEAATGVAVDRIATDRDSGVPVAVARAEVVDRRIGHRQERQHVPGRHRVAGAFDQHRVDAGSPQQTGDRHTGDTGTADQDPKSTPAAFAYCCASDTWCNTTANLPLSVPAGPQNGYW